MIRSDDGAGKNTHKINSNNRTDMVATVPHVVDIIFERKKIPDSYLRVGLGVVQG